MSEMHENYSFRNFIMLSRKMHILFLQYILGGRRRAPPEYELTYLIPTFQNGAKTDRRALQSKFKSWARRMFVENNKLKLICSGKEIIPLEDCCKIVMGLHFQTHHSVSQVIDQIQEKYTWTKKNFGLDREMIVDFILKNCNNQDCIRAIKRDDFVRNIQCNDFIKGVIHSPGFNIKSTHNPMLQSSAQTANPSTLHHSLIVHNRPIKYPLSTSSQEKKNSFPCNLKITNVRSLKPVPDNSTSGTLTKRIPPNLEFVVKEPTNKLKELSGPNVNMLKASKSSKLSSQSFRKPKNINDFKALLKAAEQFTDYPAVLCNPKTKFLSNFGLVPKRICSKKTLAKVDKDRKRKRVQDKQNMIYHKNRKNLRDRNKLNKIKLKEIEKRAYLDNFKRNSVDELSKVVSTNSPSPKYDNAFDKSDEFNNAICSADNEIEIVKVVQKADEPEVIDIISSDDESCLKDSTSNDKTMLMNGDKRPINMEETKTVHPLHIRKVDSLKINNQNSKVGSTSSLHNSETQNRYHPIFKKPYILPWKSKGEVAILPSSQWRSKVLLSQNKTFGSLSSQNSMPVKLSKSFMQCKKPILQPVSKVAQPKSFSVQKLTASGIANKIPLDTNVYLVQKQPSGIIKMVPCKRVIATDNNVKSSKGTSKEELTSVIKSGSNVSSLTKTKYRNILPAPDKAAEMNRLKAIDANKVSIDEEMAKLSKWIGGMKSTVSRTYFQLHVQRTKQKLETQLNAAIGLVKNIRRKLWEIEKLEEQVNGNVSTDTRNTFHDNSGPSDEDNFIEIIEEGEKLEIEDHVSSWIRKIERHLWEVKRTRLRHWLNNQFRRQNNTEELNIKFEDCAFNALRKSVIMDMHNENIFG